MGSRIHALKSELKHDWDELNLAAKSLVIIGGLQFGIIIYFAVVDVDSLQISKDIEVIFRSSLASVFGFILSSNTKTKEDRNKDNYMEKVTISLDKEKAITEDCKMKKETLKYYYGEGNTVQIVVALLITLISALVILGEYTFSFTENLEIIGQFRDLMCTSIGFLLGEAKIKSKS